MENLTAIVPFWNGRRTIKRLLDSLPAWLPVVVVDDCSDEPFQLDPEGRLQLDRPGLRIIRLSERGYFSGAVNAGMAACRTDALVLNQDAWLEGEAWVGFLHANRERHALIGEGVTNHPAWPAGYVQGTFMYVSRDAWDAVGPFNGRDYPLWGATCEWQLRACRAGFGVLPARDVPGLKHGQDTRKPLGWRVGGETRTAHFGAAIAEALLREPKKGNLFIRTPPAVSVVMPCFNYGHHLADAVNSLVGGPTSLGEMPGQTFQSFEVVVVDDASTDGETPAIVRAMADPRKGVRAFLLERNRGTAGAINAGVGASYGRYVHILSADDMREPFALEKLYRACEAHPHSVVYGDVRIFAHGKRLKRLKLADYDFDELLVKNSMPAGVMYPRQAWEDVGGYPEQMRWGREDWAFNVGLGIAGYCGVKVEGESGNLYRRERQNRSLRNQGPQWRQRFIQQLRGLYPDVYEGSRPMGCCGGGRGNNPRPRKVPVVNKNLPGRDGFAILQYVGGNAGSTTWWGSATGTRYRFGNNDTDRVGYVDAADAPGLLDMREGRAVAFRQIPNPKDAELKLNPAEAEHVNPGTTVTVNPGKRATTELLTKGGDKVDVAKPFPGEEGPQWTTVAETSRRADGELDAGELIELASAILTEKEIDATKAARKLAKEHGIDINEVEGTGKDGRVTAGDVRVYVDA